DPGGDQEGAVEPGSQRVAEGRRGPPARVTWIWWAAVIQATLPRAASPTEPPTSGATLTTLEASPESAGLTRHRASATKGTETRLNPKAAMMKAPKTWPRWLSVAPVRDSQYIPPAPDRDPATISGRGPMRGSS